MCKKQRHKIYKIKRVGRMPEGCIIKTQTVYSFFKFYKVLIRQMESFKDS